MALLIVLAVTALVTALISELAFSTLVDLRLAETSRDSNRAFYLAKGGIEVGRKLLLNDQNDYDGLDEPWARGVSHYAIDDVSAVSLTLTPLDGRINLNGLIGPSGNVDSVIKGRCIRLFEALEIKNPQAHVDALIDWLDADEIPQPEGAESRYYVHQDPSVRCQNGPMESLEELGLIAGFSSEEIGRLKNHVTLYGDTQIHLNSATQEVLSALAEEMDRETAQRLVEVAARSPFRSLEDLKTLPGWESFYWAINTQLRLQCQYYQISSEARVSDGRSRIRAIVDKKKNILLSFQAR